MNTRRKGNRARVKVRKLLEGSGWKVAVVESSNMFAKERDLFNVADLIAIKKNRVLFVQVRDATWPHPHGKFVKFFKEFGGETLRMSQYHFKERQLVVYEYFDWGYNRINGNIVTVVKVRDGDKDDLSVV